MTDQPQDNPAYQAAATAAVGQVQQPDQGTDAGESVEEMQSRAVRAALSDFEQRLNDSMSAAQAQFSSYEQTIADLTRQLSSVRQQAGPPVVQLLAKSLAQRVTSIAQANPDLGAAHFAGVASQAASLADEVDALAGGKGDQARAEQLANSIGTWFTRVHQRLSGKHLEGLHSALDEAERILEELPKLAPAASAIASVL